MKKIILIFFVLIFSGCQTTQNVRNTQFSKGDLEIFPNHKWNNPGSESKTQKEPIQQFKTSENVNQTT